MGEAKFETLGFSVDTGDCRYHDDGYVRSIHEGVLRLSTIYPDISVGSLNCHDLEGLHYVDSSEGNSHIFYLKYWSRPADIRLRAHEETHALRFFGQLDVLSDRLLQEQRVRIDLGGIDESEVIAELGALYALNSRGFGTWRFLYDSLFSRDFMDARRLYNKSRKPSKFVSFPKILS